MTAKISNYQLAALLATCNVFSEVLNFSSRVSVYGMQRHTVILVYLLVLFVLYAPMMIVSAGRSGQTAFSVIADKNKIIGWIIGVFFIVRLLYVILLAAAQLEFYVTNTILPYLPTELFVAIIFAAAVYGINKGVQASARVGALIFGVYVLMLIIITLSVRKYINLLFLYPALLDNPQTFAGEVIDSVLGCGEIFIFAVMAKFTTKKSYRSVFMYLAAVLIVLEWYTFLFNTVLGRYLNSIPFPTYTLASFAKMILFERMDGINAIVAVIIGTVKIILSFLCVSVIIETLTGSGKAAKMIASALAAATAPAALFFIYNKDYLLWDGLDIYKAAALLLLIIVLPLAALIMTAKKKGRDKDDGNQNGAEGAGDFDNADAVG